MFTLTMESWARPKFESHHEDTSEPCMNDKCNVNSYNECMRPQNQIRCGTSTESTCRATTNVSRNQWCATYASLGLTSRPLQKTPHVTGRFCRDY